MPLTCLKSKYQLFPCGSHEHGDSQRFDLSFVQNFKDVHTTALLMQGPHCNNAFMFVSF